jgi:hypothetical protein
MRIDGTETRWRRIGIGLIRDVSINLEDWSEPEDFTVI